MTAYKWITHVFEPVTATSDRRLLIVNGHGSHVRAPFICHCLSHSIDLMILPLHSSHKMQPLDVGIFGPFKHYLAKQTKRNARYDPGRTIKANWAANLARA